MVLFFPPKGQPFEEDDSRCRADFAGFSDEEIKNLRQKYKRWEKAIFSLSWAKPSVERYVNTCLCMSEALDKARRDHDTDVVYCPWIFEGLHTLMDDVIKPVGEDYSKWKTETEDTIQNVCAAFGYLGKFVTGYVNEMFPANGTSKCKWTDAVRHQFSPFFEIDDRDDVAAFVEVAVEILYDLKCSVLPRMKVERLEALTDACLTNGWPKASRIAEDEPRTLYNLTNDEILNLMGHKLPNAGEREKIDRECQEESIREKLDGAEAAAEALFSSGEWYLKSNVEIALWRLTREACAIARKAQRDHGYYCYEESEVPSVFLSSLLRSSRPDAFTKFFTACSTQVGEELPRMVSTGFKREMLMSASRASSSSVTAMMHYLEMLPHDSHLNAATRAAEKWTTRLDDIVHGSRRLEKSCHEFIEAAYLLGEELQLASDALNECESKIRQRLERKAHGDDPLVERLMRRLKTDPIPTTVDGFSKIGRQEALAIVRSRGPVKGLFSQTNMAKLFGTHVNTIANWMKLRAPSPEGFTTALEQKNYDGMIVCAAQYRADRDKRDVVDIKKLVHNISDELMLKLGANLPDGRCETPQ